MNDLDRLERAKGRRPGAGEAARLLRSFRGRRIRDAASLIRFHDTLLFLRAYPHSRTVRDLAEVFLSSFGARIAEYAAAGGDMSAFDDPEVSGITGASVTTDYSYDIVRWLARRFGRRVRIEWEGYEATDRLRAAWPAFLPLLEEEALEDANVPYQNYLRAARGGDGLQWLLSRIEGLPLAPRERGERYDALGLSVCWSLGDRRATRTHQRFRTPRMFFHDALLISRRDVSLAAEVASPPLRIRRLARREALAVLEMAREATALRYREYYAFTYGDPAAILGADAGRGLQIFLVGTQRGRRLPLRSGYGGFLVKNGVPIGYFEALAFFERMELGFNLYYAFREGESAWTFARSVKFLRQALGVTSFSLDPYQLGHENEEALSSGAFWFYRKLGFQSTDPGLRSLTSREEEKIAADPSYRSPTSVLRRLASKNLLYEVPAAPKAFRPASTIRNPGSPWERFHIRNLGLAVVRRMAREFGGDAARIREASQENVRRGLGISIARLDPTERSAFSDFALLLDLIPDLTRWARADKDAVAAIVRAKAGRLESRYLRLLQRHARLRDAVLRIGFTA